MRKRRLELGLFQKDVAVTIGVDPNTITNWEKNRTGPPLRFIPRITKFLGYEPPGPASDTLGQTIKRYRYVRGISQKELARRLGVDQTTLARWETGKSKPSTRIGDRLNQYLRRTDCGCR